MVFIEWAFNRLAEGAAISLVLFAAGSLAVVCCRQPVHRLRIILLTLTAALFAPLVNLLPGLPHWTLPSTFGPNSATLVAARDLPVEKFDAADELPRASAAEQQSLLDQSDSEREPSDVSENESEAVGGDPSDRSPTLHAMSPTQVTFPNLPPQSDPSREANRQEIERPAAVLNENASAPTPAAELSAAPPAHPFDFRLWAVGAYLTGAAALFAWWLFGMTCLWRLVRTATPAPEACRALLREIAGDAANDVKVLVSARAAQPCTFAWRYPVIVLPLDLATATDEAAHPLTCAAQSSAVATDSPLRFCLAHEFAHVARGDVWLWSFAGVIRLVYYYQPLCWWLRGQLRLCQDYLADAAAARLASPAIYAEFLATRAAGVPLALGLGIAGSKSDLYRRVAMLVENPLKMESRCSTRWTIAAVSAALALTLFAVTFSSHPAALAANDAIASDAAIDQSDVRRQPQPESVPVAGPESKSTNTATTEKELAAALIDAVVSQIGQQQQTPAQKQMLERLATRTTRFAGGTIRFERKNHPREENRPPTSQSLSFMMLGTTWLLRGDNAHPTANSASTPNAAMVQMMAIPGTPASSRQFTLVEGARCLEGILAESVRDTEAARLAPLRVERQTTLSIKHAEAMTKVLERKTPFGLGTIYYESGRRFIRDHSAAARFSGVEELEVPVVEGTGRTKLRTQVIEWDVAGEDADEAFPNQNSFLARGGILRVYVVEELDDLVARIEGIDRFGTVQFSALFVQAKAAKSGVAFPTGARFESGEFQFDYTISELVPLDLAMGNVRFPLSIPAGVTVIDECLKKADFLREKKGVPGAFLEPNADEYPFHTFTTTAAYPEGFPKKLLDEIDRGVLPWDPTRDLKISDPRAGGRGRAGSGSTSRTSGSAIAGTGSGSSKKQPAPAENTNQTASDSGKAAKRPPIKAGRYGGKDFIEWRDMLVDDLDPVTRIQALEALGTFGANGYAEEVAQVIAGILLTGKQQSNNDRDVFRAACSALERLGDSGIPVLQSQLDGNDDGCRFYAVFALVKLSHSTDATLPALLMATQDSEAHIRLFAYPALVERFLNSPPAFNAIRAAFVSDDLHIRGEIVKSFKNAKLPADEATELLKLLLEDPVEAIRACAAAQFAVHASGTAENIGLLKKSILASPIAVRAEFIGELSKVINGKARPDPEMIVPVLISLLKSSELRSTYYPGLPWTCIEMLGNLAQTKITESAIPVLIELVNRGSPNDLTDSSSLAENVKATEVLGKLGRAAKDALPALKRRLNECDDEKNRDHLTYLIQATGMKSIQEYQFLVRSTIRKIEGE